MASPHEIREQIQKVLEPYILPREEAAYRRRILAAHLESCVRDGALSSPLALVQPLRSVNTPQEARGLHREYLKALNANISARTEYDKVKDELSRSLKSGQSEPKLSQSSLQPSASNPLEEHLVKIKLQRKQERLRTVEKHIALLNQKPAASPEFLDPDEIFRDTRPLPDVPREVVEGLALGDAAGKADLKDLIDRLEKQVLRANLLLKSEEKLLDAVKSRSTVRPESVTDNAKLAALNATRAELINWMETELSKVPGDETDGEEDDSGGGTTQDPVDSARLDEQLASIRGKYAQYLVARKTLLQLVGQQQEAQPAILPPPNPTNTENQASNPSLPTPTTYLLTPNLSSLLSLSREQKGLIAQKSHLNITISKQLKETVQLLDHLAEESNLLPSHPVPGAAKSRHGNKLLGFSDIGIASETFDSSSRVKPWAYAADLAKIATLEAVAERIEEGQVALEGSMGHVMEVERLLGRGQAEGEKGDGGGEESDIWLAEGRPSAGRKHARKETKVEGSDELWAFLDGALGVLKAGE